MEIPYKVLFPISLINAAAAVVVVDIVVVDVVVAVVVVDRRENQYLELYYF